MHEALNFRHVSWCPAFVMRQGESATDEAFSMHQDEKDAQWSQLVVEVDVGAELSADSDAPDLLALAFTNADLAQLRTRAFATAVTAPFVAIRSIISGLLRAPIDFLRRMRLDSCHASSFSCKPPSFLRLQKHAHCLYGGEQGTSIVSNSTIK
jgi:hypothetical protein